MQYPRSVIRSHLLHEAQAFRSMLDIADELHLDPRTLRRTLTGSGDVVPGDSGRRATRS